MTYAKKGCLVDLSKAYSIRRQSDQIIEPMDFVVLLAENRDTLILAIFRLTRAFRLPDLLLPMVFDRASSGGIERYM